MAFASSAFGGGRHGPADDHPVEAVHDGAKMNLAGGYPELGDVGEPRLVRRIGVEVAFHQVLRCVGYLAFVGAVPPFLATFKSEFDKTAKDEALSMIEEAVDGGPLLRIVVAPMAPSTQAPVFREPHVPQPEDPALG